MDGLLRRVSSSGGETQFAFREEFWFSIAPYSRCRKCILSGKVFIAKFSRLPADNRPGLQECEAAFLAMVKKFSGLDHPNVDILEVVILDGIPAILTTFYPKGDILHYIAKNPNVNKAALIQDTAEGLLYLHIRCIGHGNFVPSNILITDSGTPKITDIELSYRMRSADGRIPYNWRFKSPQELQSSSPAPPTAANDVYSFGITLFKIFTGKTPRGTYVNELTRMRAHQPRLIPQPPEINAIFWQLIQKCWADEVTDRATMGEVVGTLRSLG